MIVFNLFAIPVLLVAGAIGAALVWMFPAQCGGPYEEITYSVAAMIVGGLGEVAGLRGRLFFLPVWLVGAGVLAWELYGLYGMFGLAAGGAVLALAVVLFGVTIVLAIARAGADMPQRLAEGRSALASGKIDEAREALADAWMLPMGAIEAPRAQHLLEVLGAADPAALQLSTDGVRLLAAARPILERAVRGERLGFFSDEANLLGDVEVLLRTAPPEWSLKPETRELMAKLAPGP